MVGLAVNLLSVTQLLYSSSALSLNGDIPAGAGLGLAGAGLGWGCGLELGWGCGLGFTLFSVQNGAEN